MKILPQVKHSSGISLFVSVGLHLLLILGFGLWNQQKNSVSLIKIPNGHSINLGSLGGFRNQLKSSKVRPEYINNSEKIVSKSDNKALETSTFSEATEVSGAGVPGGDSEASALSAKQKYFLEFRNIIESRKQYPTIARIRGMEGIVVVAVTIKSNGEVSNHKIIKESGYNALDEATLNLVKKINMFKSFPVEFTDTEIELKFPVAYKLNG